MRLGIGIGMGSPGSRSSTPSGPAFQNLTLDNYTIAESIGQYAQVGNIIGGIEGGYVVGIVSQEHADWFFAEEGTLYTGGTQVDYETDASPTVTLREFIGTEDINAPTSPYHDTVITITLTDVVEWTGPTVVSTTAISDTGVVAATFTPFTAQDLSNCAVALVWIFATGNFTSATASTGWVKAGQRTFTNGVSVQGQLSLWYKVSPTNNETLLITGAATSRFGAVLERIANGTTVIWNSGTAQNSAITNLDPASYDTGASRSYLFTAAVNLQSVDASAGPSGYSNFTSQNGQGGTTSSVAIATLQATGQVQDPGAFTNGTSRGATAVAAVY
jgi:hypothetical protein